MNTTASGSRILVGPLAGLVLGLAVTLYAQFGMDALADGNDLFHWLQHGMLFAGGVTAGICGALAYLGTRRA